MRADIIRTYKTVHTWTGIVTGMFLFVAFYAGAIAVFEPALTRWGAAPAATTLTPIGQTDALIARVQAEKPEIAKHFTVNLGDAPDAAARITAGSTRGAQSLTAVELTGDGALSTAPFQRTELGQFVDDLHRTGGLPVDPHFGAMLMGIVSALYVVALISGIVIILPSLIRDLLALRLGDNLKRLWMDAHNLVGVVSLPFHIIIAVTAVVFGLHDEIYDALDIAVYESNMSRILQAESPLTAVPRDSAPAPMLPTAALLERLHHLTPDFQPYAMEYRNAGTRGASVIIWGHDENYLMRGRGFALLSAVSGEVLNTDYLPGHQSGYGTVIAAFFALHFATFGGPAVKWGYFALGLAGAFLFYSGNLLWIESRRRREKRSDGPVTQSRNTRWMAAATIGICLGCVAGLSATVAVGRWLPGVVKDPLAWWQGIYYAVFLAFVAWSFQRGAARAGIELLYAAAAVTVAIPAVTLVMTLATTLGLGSGQATDAATETAVTVTTLTGAAAMVTLARAVARRARSGPNDSVWAFTRPATSAAP